MIDDNVVSMKDFWSQDSRITVIENAIVSLDRRFEQIDKRFDKIDNDLKDFRKEMKSEFRWVLTIITGLGAIMGHGFHWF
jgi:archaellum component FlaC